MSSSIEIRAHNVGFGDCILLRLPDASNTRHVLIDFGRAPNDAASLERFPEIARDIAERCDGHLDLIVMTHEHLDHIEGFYRERATFDRMEIDQVWMSLPSHPDYYRNYRNARPQKTLREAMTRFAALAPQRGMALHPSFQALLENNIANKDRIDYLRNLGKKPVVYLARGKAAGAASWSKNIKVHVLAPEADTSVYYSRGAGDRARGAALRANGGASPAIERTGDFRWDFPSVRRAVPHDLPGFSMGDFERLRRAIREDGVAAARFIDRAQNNTSLCLLIEVQGKRLLLPGDAELESWEMIRKFCGKLLQPVDFLKVSHHGSHNGTPEDLLDILLPVKRANQAQVLVSTKKNVYGTRNPVPDQELLGQLAQRCARLVSTDGMSGTHVDLRL